MARRTPLAPSIALTVVGALTFFGALWGGSWLVVNVAEAYEFAGVISAWILGLVGVALVVLGLNLALEKVNGGGAD